MNGEIVGNHSDSLSFELSVVEVDSEVFDGGLFALKSSLKSYLVSSESLYILGQNSNSLNV